MSAMDGIQLDLISESKMANMTSMEKIRMILDGVREGKILVLESGLTPSEQMKLIEMTMTEITPDEFSGIEIETYPSNQRPSFLSRILKKRNILTRLTVVGPADKIKTVTKNKDLISAILASE